MTYSTDLKTRLVDFYNKYNGSIYNNIRVTFRSIAAEWKISKSILQKWVTYISNPKKTSHIRQNIDILNFIKRSLDHNPFQCCNLLVDKIFKKFNITVSKKTVSNYIKIINYSKKKLIRRLYNTKNLKDHLDYRKQKLKEIQELNKEDNIICLDECSINRNTHCKYGYCKKDRRLIRNVYIKNLPINHSLIMAINKKGVLYHEIHKKSINTDKLYDFLKKLLVDKKNKYILMDNVSFHKSKRIRELIEDSGNCIIYIPPYSPDFNPIEEVFSKLKSYICNIITPLTIKKDIGNAVKKFIKSVSTFKMYYAHAFNK